MELRHLRYFVAIAEERSFTRAAERLWVAQPGLSTQIRRLEEELGVQLFCRHTRGVDLTDAGERFLDRARVALLAAEAAGAVGRDLESGAIGTLRVGIGTCARWARTASLLQRFSTDRAGVELTVVEAYGGTLWRDLRDGRLDAVLVPDSFASGDLRQLRLGSEPWVAVIGERHRLTGTEPLAIDQLDGEEILITGQRDGAALDRAIAELFEEFSVAAALVRAVPGPALTTSVAAGAGVWITTGPEALASGTVIRPLRPSRHLPFVLLWRDETPSAALEAFVRTAAEVAGDRRADGRRLAVVA